MPRAGVPRPARATFVRALPCLIALWALGGFTVVFAGAAFTHAGLHDVALVYAGVVAALAALGAATSVPRTKSASMTPRQAIDLPPCPATVPLCIHGDAVLRATAPAGPA